MGDQVGDIRLKVISVEGEGSHAVDGISLVADGKKLATLKANAEQTWAGVRSSFAHLPGYKLAHSAAKAFVDLTTSSGVTANVLSQIEIPLSAMRDKTNTFQVFSVSSPDGKVTVHLQSYTPDPQAQGDDLDVPLAPGAPPPSLLPQMPGPSKHNTLKEFNNAIRLPPGAPDALVTDLGVTGTALPAKFRTLNGPLPPDPRQKPPLSKAVRDQWDGYTYTPPPPQSTKALKVEDHVQVAKPEPGQKWVNEGAQAYLDVFHQDSLDQNAKNDDPVIPDDNNPENEIRLHALIRKLGLMFVSKAKGTGCRATHPTGVGAAGLLTLTHNPSLPGFPVFNKLGVYKVALRHATLTLTDDAAQDARGCAFRLIDPVTDKPVMDFAFNTGERCVFWTLDMVYDFALAQSGQPQFTLRDYLQKYPRAVATLADGVRRAPSSFANLTYSSQISYEATADGKEYLVRFRVIPKHRKGEKSSAGTASTANPDIPESQEGGLFDASMPSSASQRELWNLSRAKDELRPPDYLRQEFAARFREGKYQTVKQSFNDQGGKNSLEFEVLTTDTPVVEYSLEIKFLPKPANAKDKAYDLSDGWYNVDWSPVGTIALSALLSPFQTEALRFNVGTVAPGFRLPRAWSTANYQSVAVARTNVYPMAQGARTGGCPRWEPYSAEPTSALAIPAGGPFVPTATPGFVGGDYTTVLDLHVPPTLSGPGYVMLPDGAKYTTSQSLYLNAQDGSKATFVKNFLFGLLGQLNYGGGKDNSIVQKLKAAYAREGDLGAPIKAYGLFTALKLTPKLARTVEFWIEDDVEFARQRLAGLNPVLIRRWSASSSTSTLGPAPLPREKSTDGKGDVRPDTYKRIQDAKTGDVLFVCDYRDLDRLVPAQHRVVGRYMAAPVVLFGVENKLLVPLAISLQAPYTLWFEPPEPKDVHEQNTEFHSWLLAKMHVATADILMHEFGTHLTRTHLVSETVLIATYQALPLRHPVFKLLRPHFECLATINFGGIRALLEPGQIVDQIMSSGRIGAIEIIDASFDDWTLLGTCIDQDLRERGVAELGSLLATGYPWAEDGMALFTVLKSFVHNALKAIYPKNDWDKDTHFVDWWTLLGTKAAYPTTGTKPPSSTGTDSSSTGTGTPPVPPTPPSPPSPGLPSLNLSKDGTKERFPTALPKDLEALSSTLAAIIWAASAQHSAVNNGQVDFCAFVPNAPMLQRKPVPQSRDEVDDAYIIDTLPNLVETLQQLGFMYILTHDKLLYTNTFITSADDEQSNAEYLKNVYGFSRPEIKAVVTEFNKNLFEVETNTIQRQIKRITEFRSNPKYAGVLNVPISVEYPYLLPSRVNLSITN